MQMDWVSNQGPLALESDALPGVLCSPAHTIQETNIFFLNHASISSHYCSLNIDFFSYSLQA